MKEIMNSITYLITGATGFLGSLFINNLLNENSDNNSNTIYACIRNCQKAQKMYAENKANIYLIKSDLADYTCVSRIKSQLPDKIDYIIHCAAATQSALMMSHPVETADSIVLGTKNVLELARLYNVKSMIYLSSMEVYGNIPDTGYHVTEEHLGDIDILSARSCYPLGKRMAEQYCYSYYKEYGVPVKIARLAQTFGTGVLSEDSRIFVQFANAVRRGKDIILHTDGSSMGNYVDSEDAVRAIFMLLKFGQNGEAYNVVNEANTMRIRDMAQLVADRIADGRIKVIYDIPKDNIYGYAPITEIRLSAAKLRELGWQPATDMEGMYRNMIIWMDSEDKIKE